MSPLPRNPAQGDAAKLGQLATGLKQENGTYGATVQKNLVGRPSTGQTPVIGNTPVVSDQHKQMYRNVAETEWTRQFWNLMAQRFPSTRTNFYNTEAEVAARDVAESVYQATPNFTE